MIQDLRFTNNDFFAVIASATEWSAAIPKFYRKFIFISSEGDIHQCRFRYLVKFGIGLTKSQKFVSFKITIRRKKLGGIKKE